MKGPKKRSTPNATPGDKPKLKGGSVKGSNEDRAKPKQCGEYAGKKTNP